jgi:hypothetical protein
MSPNQNPEQIARDAIDAQLRASGWAVQARDAIDFHAGEGQAVREYRTEALHQPTASQTALGVRHLFQVCS